jgi:hypothetical protein
MQAVGTLFGLCEKLAFNSSSGAVFAVAHLARRRSRR